MLASFASVSARTIQKCWLNEGRVTTGIVDLKDGGRFRGSYSSTYRRQSV